MCTCVSTFSLGENPSFHQILKVAMTKHFKNPNTQNQSWRLKKLSNIVHRTLHWRFPWHLKVSILKVRLSALIFSGTLLSFS